MLVNSGTWLSTGVLRQGREIIIVLLYRVEMHVNSGTWLSTGVWRQGREIGKCYPTGSTGRHWQTPAGGGNCVSCGWYKRKCMQIPPQAIRRGPPADTGRCRQGEAIVYHVAGIRGNAFKCRHRLSDGVRRQGEGIVYRAAGIRGNASKYRHRLSDGVRRQGEGIVYRVAGIRGNACKYRHRLSDGVRRGPPAGGGNCVSCGWYKRKCM